MSCVLPTQLSCPLFVIDSFCRLMVSLSSERAGLAGVAAVWRLRMQLRCLSGRVMLGAALCAAVFLGSDRGLAGRAALPAALSDEQFWSLVTSSSEPGGYFRS